MIKEIFKNTKFKDWSNLLLVYISRYLKRKFGLSLLNSVCIKLGNAKMHVTVEGGDGLLFWGEIASHNPYKAIFDYNGAATLVDCGANTGAVTCQLLTKKAQLKSCAIEPHPMTFAKLDANVTLNGLKERVRLFNCALGAENGLCEISVHEDASMAVVSSSTYGTSDVRTCESISVRQITVDDVAREISGDIILKIDVEGWEEEVLKGATQTLKIAKIIILECHTEMLLLSCKSMLLGFNFNLKESRCHNGLWILVGIK